MTETAAETYRADEILAELEQLRADSAFSNLFSGLQQFSQTTGNGRQPGEIALSDTEVDNLYRFNPFASTVVDLLPDSMTQKWVIFKSEGQESVAAIQKILDSVADKFNEALKLARKYGGSALLLGADDKQTDYKQPLNERNIRAMRWLNVLSSIDIRPASYNENPLTENYGQPETYRLTGSQVEIHHSRLLRFDGVKLSDREMKFNGGWGDSVLTRCNRELDTFTRSHQWVFGSLKNFNWRFLKMKSLASTSVQPGGKDKIQSRLYQLAMLLNALGVAAIDAENEDFLVASHNYAGVLELLKHSAQLFAGATDLPPSKLFSLFNSSGLASEDSTQERYWSSYVANRQNRDLLPRLERYTKLLLLSADGPTRGELIPFELEFPSLFQLTELEEQQLKDSKMQTAERAFKTQAATSDEIARSLAEGIPLESAIDLEARKAERSAMMQMPEGLAALSAAIPKTDELVFDWDGQPRDSRGRFAAGSKPGGGGGGSGGSRSASPESARNPSKIELNDSRFTLETDKEKIKKDLNKWNDTLDRLKAADTHTHDYTLSRLSKEKEDLNRQLKELESQSTGKPANYLELAKARIKEVYGKDETDIAKLEAYSDRMFKVNGKDIIKDKLSKIDGEILAAKQARDNATKAAEKLGIKDLDPSRLDAVISIASSVGWTAQQKGEKVLAIKDKQGNLQALATYKNTKNGIYIDLLASAPHNIIPGYPAATKGAGSSAIEAAIKLGLSQGKKGEVTLSALRDAIPFYEKIGFVKQKGSDDILPDMKLSAEKAKQFLDRSRS